MQLTRQTDFGLRTLIFLALRPAHRASASEIAGAFEVSQNHLMKVINRLATAGFIKTYRGKRGGLSLAMAPGAIRIGAVVRALEDDLRMIKCTEPLCPALRACRLKDLLQEALGAFLAVLDDHTLDDLVRDHRGALLALLLPAPVIDDRRQGA